MRLRFLRSRRFWLRAGFAAAGCAGLLALGYFLVDSHGRSAWESYEKEAHARGVKLEFREFTPPAIPDAENFGAVLILKEMLSLDTEVQARMEKECKLPDRIRSLWKTNRGDFILLQKEFVELGWISASTEDAVAGVLMALNRYEPILDQLREAMARPGNRLMSQWKAGSLSYIGHAEWFVPLSEILSLRISSLLQQERNEAAMSDWRLQMRLLTRLQSEPSLLAALMQTFLLAEIVGDANAAFGAHQWNESDLSAIGEQLGRLDVMARYAQGLMSERAFHNDLFDQLKTHHSRPTQLSLRYADAGWQQWLLAAAPAGWFDENKLRANQWFDRLLAEVDPDAPLAGPERFKKETGRQRPWLASYCWPLPYTMIASLRANIWFCLNTQTRFQLCRIACALELNRLRHGSYPESLDALVPEEFAALPKDAFGNENFDYAKLPGDQFKLVCVRANRRRNSDWFSVPQSRNR